MERPKRLTCALVFVALLTTSAFAHAQATDPAPKWPALKAALFGNRTVNENAGEVLYLSVRNHPENASTVPISIRARIDQTPERYIQRIYLVIDENPSPFGVRFTLTPRSGRADIETRVRVQSASPVRAIAELNDGSLWMQSALVDGAGGCTAAIGGSQSLDGVGEIHLRVDENASGEGEPLRAQLMVQHPQYSGMASNAKVPAHFVRQVNVYYAEQLVMTADLDFTISQNPNFRFYFTRTGDGELRAEVVDSTALRFEERLAVHGPQ